MRSAEDFNRYYAKADPWGISRFAFRDRVLRDAIAGYASDRTVLELGCGEGHLTQAVFRDARAVTGVDISDVAIARATAHRLPNASFQVADFLDIPFSGYDTIAAIECLYYLSPAEREAVLAKVATEHRGKPFILSAPIIGGKYFTHGAILDSLSRHGMKLVEFHNIDARWDTLPKRAFRVALGMMPLGHRLLDHLPDALIYQRCYVAT